MRSKSQYAHRYLYPIFFLIAAAISGAGYSYYTFFAAKYRVEVERQLRAVAELKAIDLAHWRTEQLGHAEYFYGNQTFSSLVEKATQKQEGDEALQQLRHWLQATLKQHGNEYSRISILDANGVEMLSIPGQAISMASSLQRQMSEAAKSMRIQFVDFYRDENDRKIYLALLIPLRGSTDSTKSIGTLLLRIDPERYLYPLIHRWPTPSTTAETLLVRREGNDVLFLNDLRFHPSAALAYTIPLSSHNLPASKAILGQAGFVEGIDYRGIPVVADLRAVPESPWFMVARMDISEVYAPIREQLWIIVLIAVLATAGLILAVAFFFRGQAARHYRERAESAESLQQLGEHLEITLKSIGDAVISTDVQGRIINMNPVASALTGWSLEEAAGKALDDVFKITNAITRQRAENPVEKALQTGTIIGLANHTVLISRDGSKRQIADSASPIRDSSGHIQGVVLIFRDVTEEYDAIETIKRSRLELKAIYDNAPVMMCVLDGNRDVLYANNALTEFTGISEEELKRGRACGVFGCIHAKETPHGCGFSMSCRECSLGRAIEDTSQNGIEHRNIEQEMILESSSGLREVVVLGATARFPESGQVNVLLCLSDITQQAQAQQSLKESEERFRSLFENMAEGVAMHEVIYDEKGDPTDYRILGYNPAFERHTEISPTLGALASEAYGAGKPPYLEEYAQVVRSGEVLHFETFFPPLGKHFSISAVATGRARFSTVFEDITERKQTEKRLRASEAFSKGVLNSLTAHIAVLNQEGAILAVNDAWKRFALENQAEGKDCLGENYLAVCVKGVRLLNDAIAAEALLKIQEVIQRKRDRFSLEYPCHSPEEDRWFSMNVTRFESDGAPYVVVAHENISQLKKAQEFLRLQEEFSRILLESVGDGIIACDANMNLVLCNQTAREWFGDNSEKLPIEKWSEYFRLFEADGIKPLDGHQIPLTRAFNGEQINQVSLTIKAEGRKPRNVLATGTAFHDEDGSQLGAVVILRDVTSLREFVDELQSSVKEKEALLREIHHRVKNNLQVISSMLSLESARIDNPATRTTLQDLRNRLRSMALLHETIYGSDSLAQVKMPRYLERLCRHLLLSMLPHPERIQLEMNIAPIALDVSQALPCGLIVNELLSNSLKHAFPNGRNGKVLVELRGIENNNAIRLQVTDDGAGLPPDFDLTKLRTLGIQLVSDLAGQLGGSLSVESNQGATFSVEFIPRTGFTSGDAIHEQDENTYS